MYASERECVGTGSGDLRSGQECAATAAAGRIFYSTVVIGGVG